MKSIVFLLIIGAFSFMAPSHLQAQIFNGSFTTGDFTNWQTLGVPTIVDVGPTPDQMPGTTQAVIQSTDHDTNIADSVSAATIEAALGTTLPQTAGTDPHPGSTPGVFDPVNGEAIYQTFDLSGQATLTFDYAFSTNDYAPYDSVGFVLDGVYTTLANPPTYNGDATRTQGYATETVSLSAGTHTLGFVAYNTNDQFSSTSLYVTGVTATVSTPEPSTWALIAAGCVGLFVVRKFRRTN